MEIDPSSPLSAANTTTVAVWPALNPVPAAGLTSCTDGTVTSVNEMDTDAVGLDAPATSVAAARSINGPGVALAGI